MTQGNEQRPEHLGFTRGIPARALPELRPPRRELHQCRGSVRAGPLLVRGGAEGVPGRAYRGEEHVSESESDPVGV